MRAYASLLGALGAVFIVFGLIGVVVALGSGGLFAQEQAWIWGNFGLGVVLLAVSLATNLERLRERVGSGEARRVGKYGSSAILSTVLGIALLGLLAFLAERYHKRWDWTEARTHSLSDQTRKVLAGLERDVEVTALYPSVAAVPVRDLLDRYAYASDRFRVTYADPQAQPAVVRRLGIAEEELGGGVVHVEIGEESVNVDEPSEQNLTNALVKLSRMERKKVYFLEGHNERPVQGEAAQEGEGLAFAAKALENENYVWEKLLLATRGEVPEDADVVVIAGATRPFHPSERAALRRYLAGGGSVMVLVDPRANTELGEDLAEWGVALGDDVVVDRVQGLFGRPVSPFAAEYAPHPITEGLREATLFHVVRSVQAQPESEAAFTTLVRTSQESWAERNLEQFFANGRAELGAEDLPGPVPIAIAGTLALDGEVAADDAAEEPSAQPRGAAARVVVFGDSDFATNQLIDQFRNRDLFVNSVNWLLGDVESISIRPSTARATRLTLSGEQYRGLRLLSLFVLPWAIAILGVFAWWWRRRAPGR